MMVLSPEREEITENKNSDAEHESLKEDENWKSLEKFINDKFYETLVNKTKDEVKIAVNTETSLLKEKLDTNNVQGKRGHPIPPNEYSEDLNNEISSEFNSVDPSLILNTHRTKNSERIIV